MQEKAKSVEIDFARGHWAEIDKGLRSNYTVDY
jgi:hypothetical protein